MGQLQKKLGKKGEDFVTQRLEKQGYVIVERNFHCRYGEVDIIAKDGDEYVFVEVKTRRHMYYDEPMDTVDHRKQKKLQRTIHYYLHQNKLDDALHRVDIAILEIDSKGRFSLDYLKNPLEEIEEDDES
jgi:putative endonuclease